MPSSQPNAPAAERPWIVAAAAILVGAAAFALYYATLLPGVDFGDTGSFQTTVGSPILTPRVGYPLYFAIGGAFLRLSGLEPARALNLVTAIEAAIASGLFVAVAAQLTGSVAAAIAGAALFAVSYTFWSQAVIAEVYALHLALMLGSLLLALNWQHRPTRLRLAAFFACYAIAFGNHLSTVLLLPSFTVFLLIAAPGGWRTMFTPPILLLALAIAAAGAAQYLWNLSALWFELDPPASFVGALRTFWFDVTKSDWRDTMVMEVPQSLLRDHAAMYWFDLRQQFGAIVPLLALAGLIVLWRRDRGRAVLLALAYLATAGFAFSYNVGDSHVFYLPSHLVIALLATCAVAAVGGRSSIRTMAAAALLLGYAGARGYRDLPALDRSGDARPLRVLSALTDRLDDQRSILLVDLNWQVANGLSYFAKSVRPEIAVGRARDVLLYAPALVRDNLEAGREVAASENARRLLIESYGPLLQDQADVAAPTLAAVARTITPGTRYAICIVRQSRDMPIDRADLVAAIRALAPGVAIPDPLPSFLVVAGVAGSTPVLDERADRPFRRSVQINGTDVEVRMEAWMTSDTIRRMGFGHVIAARRHTLIVERGVSFATFDESGAPLETEYFASIFARPTRYLIRTAW